MLKVVEELNANPEVHGILVQLPLPSHINEERILNAISIEKDVDGFHPLNIGKLSMKGRTPLHGEHLIPLQYPLFQNTPSQFPFYQHPKFE